MAFSNHNWQVIQQLFLCEKDLAFKKVLSLFENNQFWRCFLHNFFVNWKLITKIPFAYFGAKIKIFWKKNIAVKLDFYLWFSSTLLKVFFVALKFKTQIQFVAFQRFSGLWRAAHHVSCGPRLHYSRKNFQKFLHPLTDRNT